MELEAAMERARFRDHGEREEEGCDRRETIHLLETGARAQVRAHASSFRRVASFHGFYPREAPPVASKPLQLDGSTIIREKRHAEANSWQNPLMTRTRGAPRDPRPLPAKA